MESKARITHMCTLSSNVTASHSGWAWQEVTLKDMRNEDQFRNEVCMLAAMSLGCIVADTHPSVVPGAVSRAAREERLQ